MSYRRDYTGTAPVNDDAIPYPPDCDGCLRPSERPLVLPAFVQCDACGETHLASEASCPWCAERDAWLAEVER